MYSFFLYLFFLFTFFIVIFITVIITIIFFDLSLLFGVWLVSPTATYFNNLSFFMSLCFLFGDLD